MRRGLLLAVGLGVVIVALVAIAFTNWMTAFLIYFWQHFGDNCYCH